MSNKHKKVCTSLNYIKHFLILASAITGCISIFLLGIPQGITSSAVWLKICAVTAGINKSIFREEKKKHDKTVFLAKTKLDSIKVLISKALIDSCISHDEFVSVNNVSKEYDDMKEGN